MKRLLLSIKFDGSNYCGWQIQKNATTVQEVIQKTLSEILPEKDISVHGCSRTDSGVHANKFCCHFDTDGNIPTKKLVLALNAKLPKDIAAFDCFEVERSFHARLSCKGKKYIYKIFNSYIRDPFKEKYFLRINRNLDIDFLDAICKKFIGKHDFNSFCASGSSVYNTIRTVTDCGIYRNDNDVVFYISADGFLYNMVRIIVGTVLQAAEGKFDLKNISEIINAKDRSYAGITAPAHGLYLDDVFYDF